MPQTVAELLSGPSAQAPADTGPPPPPPGFTVSNDIPPPPPGFQVQAPQQRTVADQLGMGVRGIMTGAAGLGDILAAPVNSTFNTVTGQHLSETPFRDAATGVADALHLAKPQTDQEKAANAIIEGGTQGVVTAGGGLAASGTKGAVGTVARALASSPATDIAASAAATGAQEVAQQHGAGPVGQLAAGLAAAVPTVAGAKRVADIVAGVTERFGPNAAKLVTEVPRDVVLDDKGALTDEGREVAAQNNLHPDAVKGAYDAADEAVAKAQAEMPIAAPPEAAQPAEAAPIAEPTGALETPPAAPPEPVAEPANDATPLPDTAQARVNQAQSERVDLTKGQATQDFGTQEKEQTLLSEPTPEGNTARQFFARQQQQISAAVDRFKQAFGDTTASAAERGQQVKDALTELRDKGKAGVSALYQQARDLATQAGDQGANLIHLDTEPLLAKLRELFIDEAVPDGVRNTLRQQAAKYGLIGENPKTVEGQTTVTLRDNTGEPAGKVTFTGPPQRLTILNAEDLRQKINQLYEADTSKQSQALKPVIDDAVQAAVERAAEQGSGDVGKAFQAARAAHVTQQQTFKAKDIVQKLIDWKKGTQTPVVLPEHAIRSIFAGGKESVTDLRKVKAVLLSNPTEKSKAAWQAIQAHAIARLFDDALVLNANHGTGDLGAISGAKLNTAIAKFGADKLKVLLSESDFNQLMKLKRIIGDATIPIGRTTNPSGTAQKVINFLAQQGGRLAGVARFVPLARDVFLGAQEVLKARDVKATAEGISSFDPKAAAQADAPAAANYARRFINVAGSDQIIAPLIASAANEQSHRP